MREGHKPQTERLQQALLFIQRYTQDNGYAPSIREIAAGIGYKAHSQVEVLLSELERQGKITRKRGKHGTIRIVT